MGGQRGGFVEHVVFCLHWAQRQHTTKKPEGIMCWSIFLSVLHAVSSPSSTATFAENIFAYACGAGHAEVCLLWNRVIFSRAVYFCTLQPVRFKSSYLSSQLLDGPPTVIARRNVRASQVAEATNPVNKTWIKHAYTRTHDEFFSIYCKCKKKKKRNGDG